MVLINEWKLCAQFTREIDMDLCVLLFSSCLYFPDSQEVSVCTGGVCLCAGNVWVQTCLGWRLWLNVGTYMSELLQNTFSHTSKCTNVHWCVCTWWMCYFNCVVTNGCVCYGTCVSEMCPWTSVIVSLRELSICALFSHSSSQMCPLLGAVNKDFCFFVVLGFGVGVFFQRDCT